MDPAEVNPEELTADMDDRRKRVLLGGGAACRRAKQHAVGKAPARERITGKRSCGREGCKRMVWKSSGGAYLAMSSRDVGSEWVLAWLSAFVAV